TAAQHGSAAALHYAQRFSVDHAAERLLSVLTDVAAGQPSMPIKP
ncbi:MAG: hypothetical protein JO236_05640, partial [Mycobacterium sp.]|nr:hypothetical protein [Mycobacterium sp.]